MYGDVSTMTVPNDKRQLAYGGSFAIMDSDILSSLPKMEQVDPDIFCKSYIEWIKSTKLNTIIGLEQFKCSAYSNATTEIFDKFYMKNHNRRFRCFRGEYVYHQIAWRTSWPDWCYIEDQPIQANDAVVISLPFSDTGDKHSRMDELLKTCSSLGVPVLVDCAYFGVCSDITFDFTYSCITDIAWSLSKSFPLAYARVGMRLTKSDNDDPLLMLNKIGYVNRIGAALGLGLIETYSPDYIVTKYKSAQIKLCENLGVQPSKTVLFGIDYDNRYPEYNRGSNTNRLGLHKHLNV